jgi:hypothetical protein
MIFIHCNWVSTQWLSMSIVLAKLPNAISDEIPFTGSGIVTCGRTDRYIEASSPTIVTIRCEGARNLENEWCL